MRLAAFPLLALVCLLGSLTGLHAASAQSGEASRISSAVDRASSSSSSSSSEVAVEAALAKLLRAGGDESGDAPGEDIFVNPTCANVSYFKGAIDR